MIFDEQLDPEQVQNLSEGSRESVAPELSDADLIDTTLIKKLGTNQRRLKLTTELNFTAMIWGPSCNV